MQLKPKRLDLRAEADENVNDGISPGIGRMPIDSAKVDRRHTGDALAAAFALGVRKSFQVPAVASLDEVLSKLLINVVLGGTDMVADSQAASMACKIRTSKKSGRQMPPAAGIQMPVEEAGCDMVEVARRQAECCQRQQVRVRRPLVNSRTIARVWGYEHLIPGCVVAKVSKDSLEEFRRELFDGRHVVWMGAQRWLSLSRPPRNMELSRVRCPHKMFTPGMTLISTKSLMNKEAGI